MCHTDLLYPLKIIACGIDYRGINQSSMFISFKTANRGQECSYLWYQYISAINKNASQNPGIIYTWSLKTRF